MGGAQGFTPSGANWYQTDLTAGYNTYGMELIAGTSVKFYLNGTLIGTSTTGVPNTPWCLIMNLTFAQAHTSGYHTVGSPTTGSSLAPCSMLVSEVQIYS